MAARTPNQARAFGRFVRLLREARGLTQEEVAERADLSADTIRRLERTEFSPSLKTLVKLAHGLRIDIATMFTSFELNEIGAPRELAAIAQTLTPAESLAALRVLCVLVALLKVIGGESDGPSQA